MAWKGGGARERWRDLNVCVCVCVCDEVGGWVGGELDQFQILNRKRSVWFVSFCGDGGIKSVFFCCCSWLDAQEFTLWWITDFTNQLGTRINTSAASESWKEFLLLIVEEERSPQMSSFVHWLGSQIIYEFLELFKLGEIHFQILCKLYTF